MDIPKHIYGECYSESYYKGSLLETENRILVTDINGNESYTSGYTQSDWNYKKYSFTNGLDLYIPISNLIDESKMGPIPAFIKPPNQNF